MDFLYILTKLIPGFGLVGIIAAIAYLKWKAAIYKADLDEEDNREVFKATRLKIRLLCPLLLLPLALIFMPSYSQNDSSHFMAALLAGFIQVLLRFGLIIWIVAGIGLDLPGEDGGILSSLRRPAKKAEDAPKAENEDGEDE